LSKSDPRCSVFEYINDSQWVLRGQTETINNNLNPDFSRSITLDYFFEKSQRIKFVMDDIDSASSSENIGEIETTIAGIMGKKA